MTAAVNARSAAVESLATEWPMLEALMGGTPAMRAAGEKFLPKFPNENPDGHKARVSTATLFPGFRRTVMVMAGKPFAKPISFSAATPVEIQGKQADPKVPGSVDIPGWADDIDLEGVNLHTFASEMMVEALAFGLAGILVEAPKPIQGAAPTVTRAEQTKAGIRPYFVRVMHGQILGGRIRRAGGKVTLAMLRLREVATVEDGEFGEKAVERVRILEPGKWRVQEKSLTAGVETWVTVEEGKSGLLAVPFVPLYGSRIAYMLGKSPLLDLAYLNTKHWQSQSDQDTILHVARVPILFAKGFQEDDDITVGAAQAIKTTSGDADMKFVEHTGAAIDAGKTSLDALEDQMVQAGAELLVKKPGARSATESANDAEANKSDLQRIVEGFEDSLDMALQFMADYAKLGSGGNVTLFKDFGAALLSEASGQLIVTMWQVGLISKQTAINELKRRGELSPEVNAILEADMIAEEGPALGAIDDGDDVEDDKDLAA